MPREPLRVTRLEIYEVALPFRLTVSHAGATRRANASLLVVAHDDQGNRGYGEVVPRDYLTGETKDDALAELTGGLWPRLKELAFPADGPPAVVLWPLYDDADRRGRTAAYAGLDVAVHDLWGRRFGVPGRLLLGEPEAPAKERLVTALIGLSGPAGASAALYRALGFRDYKVKVGSGDLARDLRRISAVRRVVGRAASLRVDANGAWSEAAAREAMVALAPHGVCCVEQPLPRGAPPPALAAANAPAGGAADQPTALAAPRVPAAANATTGGPADPPPTAGAAMRPLGMPADPPPAASAAVRPLVDPFAALPRLGSETWMPVMADESLCTRADAERLLAAPGDALWNLRLAKVGGFTGLLQLAALARQHSVRCQLGALVGETGLLAAAARACLGVLDFAWVESSFSSVLLRHDPFRPRAPLAPRLTPLGDAPGLGVELEPRALAAVTVARTELA